MKMTRINSAINVKCLTDEHLLAEHREIKRLPNVHLKVKSKIPEHFVLGTGHVLFFTNKNIFTLKRYFEIHNECLKRGFNVEDYSNNWNVYKTFMDYIPTEIEKQLLIERITTRINESKKEYFHYYGKQISKELAINILNNATDYIF